MTETFGSPAWSGLVPVLPPSLNVWMRQHWAKQEREKQVFQEAVQAVLNEKGNVCPKNLEAVRIKAMLFFSKRASRRDGDNFHTPLYKWTQDVLVFQHIIPDDDTEHCVAEPVSIAQGSEDLTMLLIWKL